MAVKLYPPVIEGALPAFYYDYEGGGIFSIPFSMNRAVGASQVGGFSLKIKTISGTYVTTLTTSGSNSFDVNDEMYANFKIPNDKMFTVGQFYKVQLAYIDNSKDKTVGYYSSVGVIKYTTKPKVYIQNFESSINQHNYAYVGVYSQNGYETLSDGTKVKKDATEKLYSYRFVLYNDDNSICADSGEQAHLTFNDDKPYMAIDEFVFAQDLELHKNYYIQYSIKTINGLEAKSPRYRLTQRRAVAPDITAEFKAELDYDNGRIKLTIENCNDPVISGTFLISRASSINNYVWEELQRFDVQSIVPETWSVVDCTIEQGATYKYSLQQYNDNGIYSDRIISNAIFADFEDAFLYDGERQLRIRYNPKVSSMKNTIQETKVDTIGGKHPIILRNGNVKYKDFPISGLVSYHMDTTETFMSRAELGITGDDDFNLSGKNITAERLFKLEVLEWLNNGKPKVFRSPAEGNYIIRLMNVSMSPNDQLGRMLHNFSATAYEIADFNLKNLEKFKLIDATENLSTQTRWKTIEIRDLADGNIVTIDDIEYIQVNDRLTYSVTFSEMLPGTLVYIDDVSVMIGATGSYSVDNGDVPIENVYIEKNAGLQGLVTFSYRSKATNVFNLVQDVNIADVPCYQYIGAYPYESWEGIQRNTEQHLYEMIEDCRTQVLSTSYIKFKARDVIDCFVNISYENWANAGKPHLALMFSILEQEPAFYTDMDCLTILDKFEEAALYHIRFRRSDYRFYYEDTKHDMAQGADSLFENSLSNMAPSNNEQYIVDRTGKHFAPYSDFYCENGATINKIQPDLFDIFIDGEIVNIAETKEYVIKNLGETKPIIQFCNGIIVEIGYMKQNKLYSLESTDATTIQAKNEYNSAVADFLNTANDTTIPVESLMYDFRSKQEMVAYRYNDYIVALENALAKYRKENGIA